MNTGIPIIRKYEGLKLRAYLCPAKVWTIGYGSTFYENGTIVQPGDIITRDRADRLLIHTVEQFERGVRAAVRSAIKANQLGALTSFAFNVGLGNLRKSTLLRKVNANPSDPTIRNEFMRWTRAGGQVLRGLERRRQEEADLYFKPIA
jgi:lysozyme